VDAYKEGATERIGLRARLIAETAVKQIFWKIIELESKHQDKPRMVKLRGKWVQVDPREWANRFDMTVTVGLGTGNQQTTLTGAMGIMQIQGAMIKEGLMGRTVNEANIYKAARAYTKAVFPKEVDSFFTDPTTMPPPQPAPNPEMLKLQLDKQKQDQQAAHKQEQLQMKVVMDERDKQFQAQQDHFNAALKAMETDRIHQQEMRMHMLQREQDNREKLAEALQSAISENAQQSHEKQAIILQGVIDQVIEQQKAINEEMRMVKEAALAPKEIVRGADGKATGVRVKKD
jgi:23S rRNA maturation mini-RNase III